MPPSLLASDNRNPLALFIDKEAATTLQPQVQWTKNSQITFAISFASVSNAEGPESKKRTVDTCFNRESNLDQVLQIDDDIANRLRAANKKVAVGRLVQWFRSVDD